MNEGSPRSFILCRQSSATSHVSKPKACRPRLRALRTRSCETLPCQCFSGFNLMFLNQQSAPWSCRPMYPALGMVFVGYVKLVRRSIGSFVRLVHSSTFMRVTFSPLSTTAMRFLLLVISMWFHSPAGFMAFLVGFTRS